MKQQAMNVYDSVGVPAAGMTQSLIPETLLAAQEEWEFELDLLGEGAEPRQLQEHLAKAPIISAPETQYLSEHLAKYYYANTKS